MASTYDQIACTRLYVICLVCLVGKAFIFHASTFESYWKWRSKAKGNVHNFSSIQQYLMIGEKSWVGFLLEKFLRQIKRDQSYFVPTLAAVRTEWKVRQKLGGQEGPRGSEHPKGPDSKRQTFWNLVWKIRIWKVQKVRHVHKVLRSSGGSVYPAGPKGLQDRGGTKCLSRRFRGYRRFWRLTSFPFFWTKSCVSHK